MLSYWMQERAFVSDALPPYRSTLADHPDVKGLLPLFVGRLPRYVLRLREGVAAGDVTAVGQIAHQLRGAGKTYGFEPITQFAAAVEDAVTRGASDVGKEVQALIAYIELIEGYGV